MATLYCGCNADQYFAVALTVDSVKPNLTCFSDALFCKACVEEHSRNYDLQLLTVCALDGTERLRTSVLIMQRVGKYECSV